MSRKLGHAAVVSIVLATAAACAPAPSEHARTGAASTTSTTAGSPTPTLSRGGSPEGWAMAEAEAASLRWKEAEAANARAARSKPRERTPEATEGTTRTSVPNRSTSAMEGAPDDAFWQRLSQCECRTGGCADSGGHFQFKGDTATKAGYVPGSSYQDQLAAAKRWLAKIGVAAGGTTAGWPRCWWVAKRGGE